MALAKTDSDADETVGSLSFGTLRSTASFVFDIAEFSDNWGPGIDEIDVSVQGSHDITLTDKTLTGLAAGRDDFEFTIRGDENDEVRRLDATLFNNEAATQTRAGFVEYASTSGSVFVSEEADIFLFA